MYDSNIGVGQGSVLLPILSTLYIAPIFHMLNFWVMNHSSLDRLPLSSFLSFVDNGLLIATDSSYIKTHDTLRLAYTHILSLFRDFGLIMEHSKTELFNFALSPGDTRLLSPPMDLGFAPFTGENRLVAKKTWRYLGVFFDWNLTFREHVKYYATKSISTVRCMRILGNSMWGLSPKYKRILYILCVIPVATYGLGCWYRPGTRGFKANMKMVNLTHSQGARWIMGAFRTAPTGGVLASAGLMPMHLTI
jgi:hypothetical protein